jgi:hypothetical protein
MVLTGDPTLIMSDGAWLAGLIARLTWLRWAGLGRLTTNNFVDIWAPFSTSISLHYLHIIVIKAQPFHLLMN